MPDRPERTSYKKVNHETRYRDALLKSREAATYKKQVPAQSNRTPTQRDQDSTENIRRCDDFDQGYCPNYRSC